MMSKFSVRHNIDGKTLVSVRCPQCGRVSTVSVNEADWRNYILNDGNILIQRAFPYLNTDDREILISGICKQCWDDLFGEE